MGVWTDQQKQVVAKLLREKLSASQIAEHIDGKSRNSVVGVVNRDKDLREIGFFRKPGYQFKNTGPRWSRTKPNAPKPEPKALVEESATVGRPIHMLPNSGACKYPVNDAGRGETHLFCGLPAEGSWCEYHHSKVFQKPTKVNTFIPGRRN